MMKPSEQMAEKIALRIGHIYFRPLMYGGTAKGVALVLDVYHELWADLTGQEKIYESLCRSALSDEILAEIGFDLRDKMYDPSMSEVEKAAYTVAHWRRISKRLKIPVPYAELRRVFSDKERLRDLFPDEPS